MNNNNNKMNIISVKTKPFIRKSSLILHKCKHFHKQSLNFGKITNYSFNCDINDCVQSFKSKSGLKSHRNNNHIKYPCNCDECTITFFSKSDLNKHKLLVHLKERKHVCNTQNHN